MKKKTADASKPEDDDDPNRSPSRNRFFKKEPKAIWSGKNDAPTSSNISEHPRAIKSGTRKRERAGIVIYI